jgi:hypothetical protein
LLPTVMVRQRGSGWGAGRRASPPDANGGWGGYARVSTDDQNLDLQRAALKAAGCGRIFEDRITGTARKRTGLARALKVGVR